MCGIRKGGRGGQRDERSRRAQTCSVGQQHGLYDAVPGDLLGRRPGLRQIMTQWLLPVGRRHGYVRTAHLTYSKPVRKPQEDHKYGHKKKSKDLNHPK